MVLDELLQGWESVLNRPVSPDDHLFDDLHAESLEILELLEVMGDLLDLYVTIDDLYAHPTPRAVAGLAMRGESHAG
ncbi:phosphopantetheine-binding protein [Dactylosporangium sp. CA-139114]|uniref:phosphopantetheine-binding protein n=1 Tax=Dactylosporangium sp. CA-139114 TaxID=3239931 RepID=UPI003D96CA8F